MTAPRHLQAIVFDFDGVIADSEPLHLRSFQAVLQEEGVALDPGEYYARYLGYDDAGVFARLAQDRGLGWGEREVHERIARKTRVMQQLIAEGEVLFPGAAAFVRQAAAAVPIAIASGALRHEILGIVAGAGLADLFAAIVAAGETPESKPSPAPYRRALADLQARSGRTLDPRRTVAIEDSRWGLDSARGAGLRCVGVTTSYPVDELVGAELTVAGLRDLTLDMLDRLCAGEGAGRERASS